MTYAALLLCLLVSLGFVFIVDAGWTAHTDFFPPTGLLIRALEHTPNPTLFAAVFSTSFMLYVTGFFVKDRWG
ncbi:MAG: hypothetical protein F4X80_03620 [Chloroflexi bacterium]|nr:hypothetical protein [Chloroflexota bacterium]